MKHQLLEAVLNQQLVLAESQRGLVSTSRFRTDPLRIHSDHVPKSVEFHVIVIIIKTASFPDVCRNTNYGDTSIQTWL